MYGGTICKETGRLIPQKGIYCTPLVTTALDEYAYPIDINGIKYKLAFQCRVRPSAIHVCRGPTGTYQGKKVDNYWVVSDPSDIRPYGVILQKV